MEGSILGHSGRLIGILLIISGAILGIAIAAWLFAGNEEGNLEGSGAILGFVILLAVIVLPLIGTGSYILERANREASQEVDLDRQRKMLDTVMTQGQVSIPDLALQAGSSRALVEDDLRGLIGLGLFSGYVDWKRGMLYSVDAANLSEMTQCPNCGGELSLAGKGLVKCEFCGAEIFLNR